MAAPTVQPTASIRLHARASTLLRRGQPWFFADDLASPLPSEPALVRVQDDGGRDAGLAFSSPTGKLAVRLCGPWPGADVPDRVAFFAQRLRAAIERRAGRLGPRDGVRLVHGDSDELPGLIVDRYGPAIVLQVTSPYVEAALDAVVPALVSLLQPEMVLARNDVTTRRFDNLPQEVRLLHGKRLETIAIEEHGVRHEVHPWTGHKTGLYLDQEPARQRVRELGKGRSVLDLFAYQGAFSLAALAGGARTALAIDQSQPALDQAQRAAERNGLQGLRTERHNVFDYLRALREGQERFDLVVLDPPAFAKSKRELGGALRGYRDLNRQALRLLAPNGFVLTCSCSHHLSLPAFEDVVRQAAAGLPFKVVLRQRLGAGPDHPVWLALPESEYLKVLLLQRVD